MRRIFGITLLLILYGSLYPFQFHVRALPGNPLWLLLHSWPASVDRFLLKDAALNVLIYIPIGVFGSLSIGNHRPRRRAAVLVLSLALVLSTSIEMLQLFDDTRTSSCLDIVMNVTGSAFGVWLACSYRTAMVRFWNRVDVRALFRPSAALLLLCCWIGYQTFPMIPDLSHTRLLLKLAVLGHVSSLSAVRTIGSVIDWLMAAHLLQTVAGSVRTRRLLPLLMLLLPARLLILARNVTWPELIGAACAWMLWKRWFSRQEKRAPWLAWAAVSVLLLRGLEPFHWQPLRSPFTWSPFTALMDSGLLSGAIFFNKTFLYGTAVRMFVDAGFSYGVATTVLAVWLGTIEAIQIHLPGRTPEITDPLYTVILGVILKMLDSTDRLGRTDPVSISASADPGAAVNQASRSTGNEVA